MDDTINTIEQLESGEYQRGQIAAFKAWVNRHHAETMGNQKNFEIERVLAEMSDFDNGPQYLHGYMPGDGNLRERVLRLSEETKQGSTGTPEKLEAYSQVLRDAALVIKKDAGWEIEPFDLGVALRFRFLLTFDE